MGNTNQLVVVPDEVEVTVKSRVVTVKGARGTLTKAFKHLAVDISMPDKKKLSVLKNGSARKSNWLPSGQCALTLLILSVVSPGDISTRSGPYMLISPSIALSLREAPWSKSVISWERNTQDASGCTMVSLVRTQKNKKTN